MPDIATERSHWYDKDGNPQHTQISKKGTERPTTIRDARKHGYVPSVTNILNILDKPGLNRWKENQFLMAALTLPTKKDESLDDFAKRVREDAAEHGKQAREKGTKIHGEIEKWYLGKKPGKQYLKICHAVQDAIEKMMGNEQKFNVEKSFHHPIGFGGKVDLHNKEVVLDIKTTEFSEDKMPKGWPEMLWQLSAYKFGLGLKGARMGNVFVSTNNIGLVHIHEWTQEESVIGWETFCDILNAWKSIKNFRIYNERTPF